MLVKRPITSSGYSGVKPMVPDLIDLDVDMLPSSTPKVTTPSSPSKMWNSPALNAGALNIGGSLEKDLKVLYILANSLEG